MISWRRRQTAAFAGELADNERVLGSADLAGGGQLIVTSFGLWVPADDSAEGATQRRIGWHLVSTARWDGRALTIVEADEVERVGSSVLLADRPPRRFVLATPGTVPQLVQARVTRSVLASERRELPGGSAVFVRRRVPGRDGVLVQVRADPGTDLAAARRAVAEPDPS